ncbi:putative ribonuclease H-like domain-containing protein [Tanacetum coccineum]
MKRSVCLNHQRFFLDSKTSSGNVKQKFVKALYGLHQAPRAWYATLSTFLLKNGYRRGTIDKTLFLKKDKNDIILVQVYCIEIIFGLRKKSRSMIGSLLYLTASRPDIMFDLACSRYLKAKPKLEIHNRRFVKFLAVAHFLAIARSRPLYYFLRQRQNILLAEYERASCCGQVLWIQNQMLDYGFNFMNTKIYIDNESTICIVKNPVYHSKIKHIAIRHHFIRDAYEKKLIQVLKIHIDDNVADLLTKAFDVSSTPDTYIVLSLIGQSLLNLFKPISIVQFSTDRQIEGTDEQVEGTEEHNEGTEEIFEGTEEQREGTEEIFEGTEEQREGTEEKVESTDERIQGTEDQTEDEIVTQATQTSTQTPTSMIFRDDETIAKVLLTKIKAKAVLKKKRKVIDPKDKGKKKIEEEDESESESDGIPQAEKKFKQLERDEELARKVQEEWEEEEERNRIAEENAANEDLIRDFDDIKARIEVDRLFAEKLQEQEREQFTLEERAKFLHDTIVAQRKFLAQQRSEAIRNKPPTKNQLRNQMMTYLKHEEVQALYEKINRSDEDFISIGSAEDERLIKRMNEKRLIYLKVEVSRKKAKKKKRRYIQNTSEDDSDKENDELRLHLTIVPDEEKEVDYEILDRKYPIKEWKTECLGARPQTDQAEHLEEINLNVVIRSNGQKRYFSTLMTRFDGVHTLVTDTGLVIHMLVEKKYPLRKEVLMQMLKLKLESEEENTMALELIKFVKKILAELESEEHKNWLVHKQTACGKDFSNPFMVDNLPKIVSCFHRVKERKEAEKRCIGQRAERSGRKVHTYAGTKKDFESRKEASEIDSAYAVLHVP